MRNDEKQPFVAIVAFKCSGSVHLNILFDLFRKDAHRQNISEFSVAQTRWQNDYMSSRPKCQPAKTITIADRTSGIKNFHIDQLCCWNSNCAMDTTRIPSGSRAEGVVVGKERGWRGEHMLLRISVESNRNAHVACIHFRSRLRHAWSEFHFIYTIYDHRRFYKTFIPSIKHKTRTHIDKEGTH